MSLTLQMSAGDDKNAVWVLRLKSEGVNQVSNGAFDDATGWTQAGDWNITGGEADYTFNFDAGGGNASGDLTITTAAVSAIAFILEYEITTVTGSGFTLSLEGTGSFVSSAEVFLPTTLGQHRVNIFGNAAGTLFRLKARTFGASDVLKIDNLKFRVLEETTYLATQDLTLDNTYDGQVLEFNNRLSDIDEFMDVKSSGSIGGVSSYIFTVARHSSNTKFDGFFEEFYPTFNGGILSSRDCEVGIVWNTASTDTEITWLMRGRIVDYKYKPRKMVITILQSTEIDTRPLPFYSVQKDFDNEISFFTNAPDDSYGIILPLVYGDFTIALDSLQTVPPGDLRQLTFPLVLVDKYKLQYIAATHKFNTEVLSLAGRSVNYKYLAGINYYSKLGCDNGSSTNNDIRLIMAHFDTLNNSDNVVTATLLIVPTLPGSNNDISDYDNLVNLIGNDELTITSTNEVALTIDGNEAGIGQISRQSGSVQIHVNQTSSVTADATDDTVITYFNSEFNSGVGGYGDETGTAQFGWNTGDGVKEHTQDMSIDFVGRDVSDVAWTWDEIFNLQFIVRSITSYTNKYNAIWIEITHIVVTDARKTIKVNRSGR